MSERQMATIRRIEEIKDIEGADLIQAYRVGGWWVVSKKGEYKINDLCIYCEIDSWIPNYLAPFLSKNKEPKEYNGIKGERLRTIKLRGQISQGLLLPLDFERGVPVIDHHSLHDWSYVKEGDDVSELLGVIKYEPPIPAQLAGLARKGGFPWYIPKSDQERIQNIKDHEIKSWEDDELTFEVTEKLEGSSMTVYYISNENLQDEGVCSRNINLKEESDNSFWKVCKEYDLLNKLKSYNKNLAIQGELVGPGIQGNHYGLSRQEFYCYNIWDIDNSRWLHPKERRDLCSRLDIPHVPVLRWSVPPLKDIEYYLDSADGYSLMSNRNILREGVVYKSNTTSDQFKVVSNKYLLGN